MVEKINLPIKMSGDTLSAIEFNQVVDKTNSLITEFNSATTLSQVTWTVGQPKPTIVADEIIGTISEGETKYVQTSTVGNQTVAILHSPNSVLTSVTQEMHVIDPTMITYVSPLVGRYFIVSDISGGYKLKHLNLDNTISTIALGNIANPNFSVSEDYANTGILTENYLIFRDNDYSSCINVIDRETNIWNEALSVKATALLMQSDTRCGSLTYDGVNLYALVETSDNEYVTDYDVNVLKLDLEFNVISTRTLDTYLVNQYDSIKCKSISVIDGMLYEINNGQNMPDNYILNFKRYNLISSEYDLSWGNVDFSRSAVSEDFNFAIDAGMLIKSGNDLLLLSTYPKVQSSEYDKFIKLNSTGTDVEVIAYPGSVPIENEAGPSGEKHISILSNTVVVIQIHMNLDESLNIPVHKLVDGEFVDVSEVLLSANIAALTVLELEDSKLAIFGSYYSELSAALINHEIPTAYVIITDLSLNPDITVTSVADYYAKTLDYYQAIVSPSDIYIPEDVRTAIIDGSFAINNVVYSYDNETETLIQLDVPGADTSYGTSLHNGIVLVYTALVPETYVIYGINDDLSLTDLTSWFTNPEDIVNIDDRSACYINGALYSTSSTPDVSGNYIITKRTATVTTTLPLTIEMTNASAMTTVQLQKLDSTHIALWNSIVEPPSYNYVLDGILTVGDSVTVTVHTATDVFFKSISWMHDFPDIAGIKSDNSLIFPADAESGTAIALSDISTPVLGLDSGQILSPAAMLDSETQRILMFLVGEQYGFFDVDSMTALSMPQFSVPVNPKPVGLEVGNILHQKSDGTYIYIRQESRQVFESTDLVTWTIITPTVAN